MNVGTSSERRKAIFKVQHTILGSARAFLERKGMMEILPPIFEQCTDTGIGDAGFFEIDYYGKPYKLMSALTIQKPVIVTQLGDVFCMMPCSRREVDGRKSKSHLSQFYQIEVELEGGMEKAMGRLEGLVRYIIDEVKASCKKELELLGREPVMKAPFRRMTYREALEEAERLGFDTSSGLTPEIEKALSKHATGPFFITSFPSSMADDRGLIYKIDGKILLDFDLILPEGYGELSSGSEREFEYDKITGKMDKEKINSYRPYLEVIKSGLKPTSGFGLGVERLTKFICGLDDIAEASLFPKIPGVS